MAKAGVAYHLAKWRQRSRRNGGWPLKAAAAAAAGMAIEMSMAIIGDGNNGGVNRRQSEEKSANLGEAGNPACEAA